MTKITVNASFKNAPNKEFIKDFNIAFATGNADFIIDHVSDDIFWVIYGDKEISGKEHFSKEINAMKEYVADQVMIHSIIIQGTEGACNGEMTMGDKTYVFCDVYKFADHNTNTIKEMRSYVLPIEKK